MATCLSCEAEIVPGDVEQGETLTCEECGAEHEVLAIEPLELALLDDDDLAVEDEDEEKDYDKDEDDLDDEDEDF